MKQQCALKHGYSKELGIQDEQLSYNKFIITELCLSSKFGRNFQIQIREFILLCCKHEFIITVFAVAMFYCTGTKKDRRKNVAGFSYFQNTEALRFY